MERKWFLIDAAGKTLGRLSTRVADVLRGKHKTIFSPHQDTGDFVIVINAAQVRLTGKKAEEKIYFRHSGYHGGDKYVEFEKLKSRSPEKVIYYAVKGMLPQNRLGEQMIKKLKVYKGEAHPHASQKPEKLEV